MTAEQGERVIALLAEIRDELRAGKRTTAPAASSPSNGGGPVFPNYGKAKGQPIAGASRQDLDYYAAGARKSIADPAKARWREKESALLAEIEREISRQNGGPGPSDAPPDFGGGDDDIPF